MSLKEPKNKEEFLDISGIGEVKYGKYGLRFKEAIEQYKNSNSK